MRRPRCADDFATIRARVAELRDQRTQLTKKEEALLITEPSAYRNSSGASPVQRPGIPGWRVARRKRHLSPTWLLSHRGCALEFGDRQSRVLNGV